MNRGTLLVLAALIEVGAADRVGQRVGVPVLRVLVGRGGVHDDVGLEVAEQPVDQLPSAIEPSTTRQSAR